MMSEYPECEKLLAIETDRRMITEFCEWLDANNLLSIATRYTYKHWHFAIDFV